MPASMFSGLPSNVVERACMAHSSRTRRCPPGTAGDPCLLLFRRGRQTPADYRRPVPDEPDKTPDGRYVVIDGRRWRATDPAIPEERRVELTRILMAWRRAVRRTKGTDEEAKARAGVQAAKVALGERGVPWWEQSDEEREARWSAPVPMPEE